MERDPTCNLTHLRIGRSRVSLIAEAACERPALGERQLSARPGPCRSLRRRSLHYALQTSIIRTYALASRLRAS
jgi:hypothetical protein